MAGSGEYGSASLSCLQHGLIERGLVSLCFY